MKDTFRFFVRKNYPEAGNQMSNEELDEMAVAFDKYLDDTCKTETLEKIKPKSEMDVVLNMDHPLRQNGFHPAIIIHFSDFVEIEKVKAEADEK